MESVGHCLRDHYVSCSDKHKKKQKYRLFKYLHLYRIFIPVKPSEKEARKNLKKVACRFQASFPESYVTFVKHWQVF